MTSYKINDLVTAALFCEGAAAGYEAIPLVVQSLFGLVEHEGDGPADTLLRLLAGLGLDTPDKLADFLGLTARVEALEEALEDARHYVATAWWNCNGGMQVHGEILDDLANIDAALGQPFFHPNPEHRTVKAQASFGS